MLQTAFPPLIRAQTDDVSVLAADTAMFGYRVIEQAARLREQPTHVRESAIWLLCSNFKVLFIA
ncbi:hypothetical protein EGT67_02640 [Prescottella agglutinans]|uniref:Uncharacterized protein n=1 Tax=Prescottella agglutinans TaxID=1644129 RepID=A0A3S3ZYW8_9NOCA|nr:hypothetical protein EGT67_02640 [Prescottella agglutinans]